MVETFRRVNDVELPYEIADRREGDVPYCVADPTKANKVLLWECKKTLDDMCRDSWRWQKNCIG
jgi:UDP-glucose 4-epimerase